MHNNKVFFEWCKYYTKSIEKPEYTTDQFRFNVIRFASWKRKLCNGENVWIRDFDEFRSFWGSWVRIIVFFLNVCMYVSMYVCMYVCMYVWNQILSPS